MKAFWLFIIVSQISQAINDSKNNFLSNLIFMKESANRTKMNRKNTSANYSIQNSIKIDRQREIDYSKVSYQNTSNEHIPKLFIYYKEPNTTVMNLIVFFIILMLFSVTSFLSYKHNEQTAKIQFEKILGLYKLL